MTLPFLPIPNNSMATPGLFNRLFQGPGYDITWFGASPSASAASNTASIQSALDRARDAGAWVFVPPGIYSHSTLTIEASMFGFGTLKSASTRSVALGPYECATIPNTVNGIQIVGLTFDGNLEVFGSGNSVTGSIGLLVYGHDIALDRCTFQNTAGAGVFTYRTLRPRITNCSVRSTRGVFGDGIYLSGATDPLVMGNVVRDVTRIGIVTESADGAQTYRPRIIGNTVVGASGRTSTEFNGGIWLENTVDGIVMGNVLEATGDYGITLAIGATEPSRMIASGNRLSGMSTGYFVSGSGLTQQSVEIADSFVSVGRTGISLLGQGGGIVVSNVHFQKDSQHTNSGGLIVVDLDSGCTTPFIRIAGCSKNSTSAWTTQGDILFFSGGSRLSTLDITGCVGPNPWTIAMNVGPSVLRVGDMSIAGNGGASIPSLLGVDVVLDNCDVTVTTPGTRALIIQNTHSRRFRAYDSRFTDVLIQQSTAELNWNAEFRNSSFFFAQVENEYGKWTFSNCQIDRPNAPAFLHGSFNTTLMEVEVRDSFMSSSATPLISARVNPPARSVLVGNDIRGGASATSGFNATVVRDVAPVPASGTASGYTGQMSTDSRYVYICASNSSWRRATAANY